MAEQLPPLPRLDKMGEIITVKHKLYSLKPVNGRWSKQPAGQTRKPLMVNHFDELRKVYKLGGKPAITEYCARCYETAKAIAEDLKMLENNIIPNPGDLTPPDRA
jgi:hypothetical protein